MAYRDETGKFAVDPKTISGTQLPADTPAWDMTDKQYAQKYGLTSPQWRYTSPPNTLPKPVQGGVSIVKGPTPLQHSGQLRSGAHTGGKFKGVPKYRKTGNRKTNQSSNHWAMYAYVVQVGHLFYLGIQFRSGYRCYYDSLVSEIEENQFYHEIVNAESGSYWCWDNNIKPGGRAYTAF